MSMTVRELEGVVKGFANHHRIQILTLLGSHPELPVTQIAERLQMDLATASEHIRRMTAAGVLIKRHEGRWAYNRLSQRGMQVLDFLRNME